MPTTPAWPPESAPRLFVAEPLREGAEIVLDRAQSNYLVNVLRLKSGAIVLLFDDEHGEYAASLAVEGRRDARLIVGAPTRLREAVPDLWLLVAPIRKGRIDWVAEKACELGVARLAPVLTRRTVVDRLNMERLRAHMIEAAEQCGRTALPALAEPAKLEAVLKSWPADRTLFFADESGNGAPMADAAREACGPAAILIGPEGGFDPAERAAIRALPQARAVSLGPRILRAETAALVAVSIWMARAGDWRS